MTETRYPGQELQDEILKTVRKSQEAVVDAIKAWADTVQSIVPKLPAVAGVLFILGCERCPPGLDLTQATDPARTSVWPTAGRPAGSL